MIGTEKSLYEREFFKFSSEPVYLEPYSSFLTRIYASALRHIYHLIFTTSLHLLMTFLNKVLIQS